MDIYIKSMPEVYTDIWPWWIYSSKNVHDIWRCSLLLRAVTGDVPHFNNNENIYLLCQSRCDGPSGKLIFILECRETEQLRLDVEEVMPLAMKNDVRLYNTRQKLVFIASRFSGYVKEWDYICHEMLRYVEAIYIKIKSMIMVNDAR